MFLNDKIYKQQIILSREKNKKIRKE